MMRCDLCGMTAKCLQKEIEDLEFDICESCWKPLAEKLTGRPKPIQADFVGLTVPNRYVFGCGMDVYGWWRNLPAIYALK